MNDTERLSEAPEQASTARSPWVNLGLFVATVISTFYVGALLVSFTVYIIPALAHILTYRTASARMVSPVSIRSFVRSFVRSFFFFFSN